MRFVNFWLNNIKHDPIMSHKFYYMGFFHNLCNLYYYIFVSMGVVWILEQSAALQLKQAWKGFRPLSAILGIECFQNLRIFREEFFGGIFWEES